jgi:cell division protein FtsI (penicillin-binding protein 3)
MTTIDPRQRERRNTRARIVVLCGLLLIMPGLVLRAAYQLQVVRADKLKAQAMQQSSRDVELAPKRGTMYDRAGAELAVSADVDSIWANPRQLQKSQPGAAEAAHQLASLLDVDEATLASRFAGSRFFVWVKRRVSAVESKAVQNLKLPGISVTKEPRRFYPNRELAANLIGMANLDGRGIDGLELMLDEKLRGHAHSTPAVHDGKGAVVYSDHLLDDRASQGNEVTLTIDKTLQHFAERELELAVRTSEAHSGTAVVLDPATGELLAIANYPTYNPNEPRRGS